MPPEYEPPATPDLQLDCSRLSEDDAAGRLLAPLRDRRLLAEED